MWIFLARPDVQSPICLFSMEHSGSTEDKDENTVEPPHVSKLSSIVTQSITMRIQRNRPMVFLAFLGPIFVSKISSIVTQRITMKRLWSAPLNFPLGTEESLTC